MYMLLHFKIILRGKIKRQQEPQLLKDTVLLRRKPEFTGSFITCDECLCLSSLYLGSSSQKKDEYTRCGQNIQWSLNFKNLISVKIHCHESPSKYSLHFEYSYLIVLVTFWSGCGNLLSWYILWWVIKKNSESCCCAIQQEGTLVKTLWCILIHFINRSVNMQCLVSPQDQNVKGNILESIQDIEAPS